jgi:hypothetical protein
VRAGEPGSDEVAIELLELSCRNRSNDKSYMPKLSGLRFCTTLHDILRS